MISMLKNVSRILTLCGVYLLTAMQPATAQSTHCSYQINNEWNTGYTGTISIANNGTSAISGWSVNWQYNTNRVTSAWNANVTGSNPYTATSLGWNGNIAPGQSVSFGFQADKNGGSAETPTINGAVCSGTTSSSSVPASSSSVASSIASSVASSIGGGQQCNWYGTLYPLCATTQSGWGWENNRSCISASTCSSQPAPYGIVGGGSSSSIQSSSSSSSSSLIMSSIASSSLSSIASSIFSSSSSSAVSSILSSSSSSSSSAINIALHTLAEFPIGVAVSAGNESRSILRSDGAAERALVKQHFDQLTPANIMKMSYLHPSENTYTFEQADALVDYALEKGMTIHGHTLVWHSDYQIPDWMKNYTGDYSAMLQQHVQTIAEHYFGRVTSWDVVNEAFADDGDSNAINGYRNSLWYQQLGKDYIEQAFIAARAADPVADLYYNDYNMEGGQEKFTHMLAMVDDFQARGIPIDGVGFQMHINIEWPSAAQIKAAFSAVVARGLKVKITELDIPVNTYSNPDKYPTFTSEAAERQEAKYREVVAAYLEVVPAELRGGITVWGLLDSDSWLIELHGRPDWPLLFNDQLEAKPALQGFADGLTGAQ